MRGIVDRIEGDFLVVELETEEIIDIPIKEVRDAKEGDVLIINKEEIKIDKEETKKRTKYIENLFNDLLE